MKVVLQRVANASVVVDNSLISEIGPGLLVLVGIEDEDTTTDIEWLSKKIVNLRIFNDEIGVMNRSLIDVDGELLVVSQFTLQASTKKGNRPSYIKASKPDVAIPIYEKLLACLERAINKKVAAGIFGADMKISLLNDGPVTLVLDSKNKS
ncbi:MAG: D-aminoacyl-tRNA deacylase [Flavicella sp.]